MSHPLVTKLRTAHQQLEFECRRNNDKFGEAEMTEIRRRCEQYGLTLKEYDSIVQGDIPPVIFQPEKGDEEVLCISERLFKAVGAFTGFVPASTKQSRWADNNYGYWMPRSECETDPEHKQIIPYVVLIKQVNDMPVFFTYKRGSAQGENRLHAKLSLGIGGHINRVDDYTRPGIIRRAARRELREELTLMHTDAATTPALHPKAAGWIYDDSNDVGLVHLGMCYVLDCAGLFVVPAESKEHMHECWWMREDEIIANKDQFENWSQIVIDNLEFIN